MELSSSQMETVEHQFDSFCKRLLKYETRDYFDSIKYHQKNEVLFSTLSQKEIDELIMTDKYPSDMCSIFINGFEVEIKNELLFEALFKLPEQARDIILLSYFLEMNDVEISHAQNIVRSTVQYQRTSSLKKLKKYMEG